ncbi:BON domain-containing protein [Amnibacterium kyonggiense]|uniref:Osmotically-inducible protein OsmY n=1 Tax=Amnibacterium kyonggiense TaxID=595671 RepID=A0A4R7FKG5_9MICO|nr:BON domain-containing protein [Amnibacterium kyonggiense]TDS76850.1 osmotically-inducible protein OsmY [Amnibacterium kyonggiense]
MPTTSGGTAPAPSDHDLQHAVREALERSPGVDAARIAVAVHDGVVVLAGEPVRAAEALAARTTALGVHGVRAVVDELDARRSRWGRRSDRDVAETVVAALDRDADLRPGSVAAAVRDGVVTLHGEVADHAERDAAVRRVARLAGVRAVHAEIGVTPRSASPDAAATIRRALLGTADVDASAVEIDVQGTEAVLTGTVRTPSDRHRIVLAAWSSPHVSAVRDRLVVDDDDDGQRPLGTTATGTPASSASRAAVAARGVAEPPSTTTSDADTGRTAPGASTSG